MAIHGNPVGRYAPAPAEVNELLRRAAAHPLGLGFLQRGALDAVAATFRVHAFTVDAARARLAAQRAASGARR